jgi:hypothetical protein
MTGERPSAYQDLMVGSTVSAKSLRSRYASWRIGMPAAGPECTISVIGVDPMRASRVPITVSGSPISSKSRCELAARLWGRVASVAHELVYGAGTAPQVALAVVAAHGGEMFGLVGGFDLGTPNHHLLATDLSREPRFHIPAQARRSDLQTELIGQTLIDDRHRDHPHQHPDPLMMPAIAGQLVALHLTSCNRIRGSSDLI